MTDRKTIKISIDNYNKLMEFKEKGEYKTINEALCDALPDGVVNNMDFEKETPAFVLYGDDAELKVSWNMIRNAEVNTEWASDNDKEKAIVIFKDDYGALLRFNYDGEFYLNYFEYL